MNKKFTACLCVFLALVCVLALSGCADKEIISAYDIAVKNGFEGTEAEWLESLHGNNGVDGQNGTDGISLDGAYKSAVEKGYTGDYLTFLKEFINVGSDNTYSVSTAILSAVTITSGFTTKEYNMWGTASREKSYTAGGAGVIYRLNKEQGSAYIITNFHVVYDIDSLQENHISQDIKVTLYGSNIAIPATFVGGSAYYDIAVIRVNNNETLKNSDARAVNISADEITVGQTAIAIGFPAGEGMSVTSGIVSVDSENITVQVDGKNGYSLRVMRVDTAINSGNSGGGLFDSDGRLIGIVNAKYNSTKIENIGYAIPVSLAVSVAENIIDNCANTDKIAVQKCMLGITSTISESHSEYDVSSGKTVIKQTVYIAEITEGGLGANYFQVGDVLVSAVLNGKTQEITRNYHLGELMLDARVGDTVKINYTRDGVAGTAEITLTEGCVVEQFVA